ncbi:MAG TPA: sulfur reduction protein DsrE [Betaproteobacteria bacterium]|nr:sulfur reduction protein DsrE [Betaproteobacteria bacterium]
MKIGMVIYSGDSETVWNAFRLGIFALKQEDDVTVFLLAKGVECQQMNKGAFNVAEIMDEFLAASGKILVCGACLKQRQTENAGVCELSTMQDLHHLIRDSDKVLTF